MTPPAHRPRTSTSKARQRRFLRRVSGLAATGFAAGAALGAGLLISDSFGLGSLVAADASPHLVALLFAGGLGLLFMPASLATGLADPVRSEAAERPHTPVTKGRRP